VISRRAPLAGLAGGERGIAARAGPTPVGAGPRVGVEDDRLVEDGRRRLRRVAVVGLRPLHPHGIRLDGEDEGRLELVPVATELLLEPQLDGARERGQVGDRDPHVVRRVPHDDPEGRLRRDAGVDDGEPARALADEPVGMSVRSAMNVSARSC
jgi:hypothetical protein